MAARFVGIGSIVAKSEFLRHSGRNAVVSVRKQPHSVSTSLKDGIPAVPLRKRLSIPIVFGCIGTGLFIGQHIAKKFAAFLEEMELFVPDDDDD